MVFFISQNLFIFFLFLFFVFFLSGVDKCYSSQDLEIEENESAVHAVCKWQLLEKFEMNLHQWKKKHQKTFFKICFYLFIYLFISTVRICGFFKILPLCIYPIALPQAGCNEVNL